MSEVNKIANYNQMMSWLTRPEPTTPVESREDFAIGGGVIQGENLGTREGFAGPVLLKTGENKGKYKVRFRDEKFGRREGQTGFNEGDQFFNTKKEADAFYKDLLSKKEAKKASGLKSKNVKVKNQAQQINTFVSDFIDQNLGKYGIKDYDKFEKELNESFEQSGIKDAGSRKAKYKGFPNIATAESEVPFSKFDIGTINRASQTDTTGNYFKKLFYTGKLKTDDSFRNRVERYLDYQNTDKKFYGDGNPIDREALKNQYADVLNDSEDIRFLLESKDVGEGKFRSGIIKQFFPEKADAFIKKKGSTGEAYKKNVATIENFLTDKQVKDTLDGYPSIKSFMKGQSEQLKKIFDVSELPGDLNFNTDHVEGIAEIAKLDNADDVMRGLRNLIGMTKKRNLNLGWKGYSKKRRELTDKINDGIEPQKNLDELNEITSESYPEVKNKKAYSLKNGVLSVTDNFKFLSNPETTFKQYFTELTSTPEGLKALKSQYKTSEGLKKILLEDSNLRKNVIVDDLAETIPGVTTADKLDKPPATVEREMFKKANERFKKSKGVMLGSAGDLDTAARLIKEDFQTAKKIFGDYAPQIARASLPAIKLALAEVGLGAAFVPMDIGGGLTPKEVLLNLGTLGVGVPFKDIQERAKFVEEKGLGPALLSAKRKKMIPQNIRAALNMPADFGAAQDLTEQEQQAMQMFETEAREPIESRREKLAEERVEKYSDPEFGFREGAMNGGIMRLGFADGPKDPSKRKFIKAAAGIASIPILGRFMKPATKAIEAAAPVIQRSVEGIPDFIRDLIAKVKAKAEATGLKYFTGNKPEEFTDVYKADNYVVTEQGNKTIIREIDQDGDMLYKENQIEIEVDPETGGVTYREASARPDAEGKLKDVEEYIEDDDLENMKKYTYDE